MSALRELDRGSAGNSLREDGFNGRLLLAHERESRNRKLETGKRLSGRLGNSGVADVANLAMLFIGGVLMPMPGCLDGKGAYSQNQGHRQQL